MHPGGSSAFISLWVIWSSMCLLFIMNEALTPELLGSVGALI